MWSRALGFVCAQTIAIPAYLVIAWIASYVHELDETSGRYFAGVIFILIASSGILFPSFWNSLVTGMLRGIKIIDRLH